MDNLEKFNHSVNVLLKAYLNDTLVHENCYACAVGNLVADGMGTEVIVSKGCGSRRNLVWSNKEIYPGLEYSVEASGWGALFSTSINHGTNRKRQEVNAKYLSSPRVKNHIESTGYTWEQLAIIEKAFEFVDKRKKDKMFNGLMAVVDALANIHNIDLTVKEQAKALFV